MLDEHLRAPQGALACVALEEGLSQATALNRLGWRKLRQYTLCTLGIVLALYKTPTAPSV
jgi:hypothetical protein